MCANCVRELEAKKIHYLDPCKNERRKRGRKLHDVIQREAVKVQYDTAAADLRGWLKHRGGDRHLDGAEQIVQRALRWLPFF